MSSVQRTNNANSNQTYSFTYDALGNMTSLKVGGQTLATYTYQIGTGLLLTQTYANGNNVSFTYDNLGRTKTATYSDGRVLTYAYDGEGRLYSATVTGNGASETYLYTYDSIGRLIYSEQKEGYTSVLRTNQAYNAYNQLTKQAWQMGSTAYSETYTYNASDGSLNTMTTGVGNTLTMGYDGLRRLTSVTGGPVSRQYTYRDIDSTKTTMQVASVTSGGQQYSYTYDSMGNIATYSAPGKATVTYTYDSQGQLLKATGDTTYTYTYDGAGNILTASDGTTTHTYTYGDADWKDLLTGYDRRAITYDSIGNPTSYYNGNNWDFTWANGRSLTTASGRVYNLSFTYDANGLRTSKTDDGIVYRYYYAGEKLIRMTWGANIVDLFYDVNGTPYAMKRNGFVYYYITNLQGDVMKLVDASGNVVASYEYDPYGKVLSSTGSLATVNPLRYRGYVYDQETGFYYLQSRYYDPAVGRFINADGLVSAGHSIISKNMFVYCGNNPVNRCDPTGCFWLAALLTVTVTALILSGCAKKTVSNAAPKYYEIAESNGDRNHNPNCYSYVLGYYDRSYDIGEFSDTYLTGKSVDAVAKCVVSDLDKLGRGCRIIESYDTPIEDNEYRIALRVGEQPIVGPGGYPYLQWDYHFMVQTESGEWAEKRGSGSATILHTSGNPSTFQWDAATYQNFYTSDIRYFAITN